MIVDIPDWDDWMPEHGFLNRYLEYTKNHEGPAVFQFWTGLTILSAVIGRRYGVSKGFYNVYPNLYTLLIAPTGKCRKTTTSKIGVSLLDDIDVRKMSTKFSPEDLIHRLLLRDEDEVAVPLTEALIYTPELTVMLNKTHYTEGMVDLLTDLADAPDYWSYSTRKGGKVELRNVCLTLLACSTSEWLGDAIPQRAFGGGFLARIVFVVQSASRRFFAIPKAQDPAIRAELVAFLAKVREQEGTFAFSEEGLAWYEEWYRLNRDVGGDLRLNGYYERKPDHLLRVAMLLAISEEAPPELTPQLLERSAATLDAIEPSMSAALKEINVSSSGRDSNRVFNLVNEARDKLSYEEIVGEMMAYMNSRAIDEALKALVMSQRIDEYITPIGRKYGKRGGEDNALTNGQGMSLLWEHIDSTD